MFSRVIDLVFGALFIAALFVLFFLWSFSAAFVYGSLWDPLIGFTILVILTSIGAFMPVSRWLRLGIVFLLMVSVCLGHMVYQENPNKVRQWAVGSLHDLDAVLFPVTHHTEEDAYYDIPQKKQRELRHFTKFQIQEFPWSSPIVVAFDRFGLMLIDESRAKLLNGIESILSHYNPDDGSLVYIEKQKGRLLVRARLEGGLLRKLWSTKIDRHYLHHWGDVHDGRLYQPGRDFDPLPESVRVQLGGKYAKCKPSKKSFNDTIEIFDYETGTHLRSVRVAPIIASLRGKDDQLLKTIHRCHDPFHFNDIQVIASEKHASFFPGGNVGDLLLSFRDIYAILLVDKDTFEVKWHIAGRKDLFGKQHSPRVTERGTLLVFDNKGADSGFGTSRIVELSIASGSLLGVYEGTDASTYFESETRGMVSFIDGDIYVQDQVSLDGTAGVFRLECDSVSITPDCKRSDIFTGEEHFSFTNFYVLTHLLR